MVGRRNCTVTNESLPVEVVGRRNCTVTNESLPVEVVGRRNCTVTNESLPVEVVGRRNYVAELLSYCVMSCHQQEEMTHHLQERVRDLEAQQSLQFVNVVQSELPHPILRPGESCQMTHLSSTTLLHRCELLTHPCNAVMNS